MAEAPGANAFVAALVADFAAAVEAVLGDTVTVAAGPATEPGEGWRVPLTASGDLQGPLHAGIDRAGCITLVLRVMGLTDDPDPSVVADFLREMWAQAASAVSLKAPFTGVAVAIGTPEPVPTQATFGVYELRAGGELIASVPMAGQLTAAAPRKAAPVPDASTNHPKLDIVLDIDLPLVVRFGRTVMSVKGLSALGPGSVVDMGRSPDEPVQVLVGEQVIARGEVVIVGGNYGVRITDLVSPADRMRAMEA